MSKRSSQRNRHQQRSELRAESERELAFEREVSATVPTGNGHAAPALPAPTTEREAITRVGEIVERAQAAVTESKQPRFADKSPSTIFSSLYRWVSTLKEPGDRADSRQWDAWYRDLVTEPGSEPHIAGTFASIVGIDKNRHYTVTGGRNQVNRVLSILQGADDGRGWRSYLTWQSTSFWATRMGFVSELGREGDGGPLRALWSVDPAAVELTSDPELPLKYYPKSGKVQEWLPQDFFRGASMGSTNEARNGLGFPFVARALDLTRVMLAVWQHDKEQLGARAPKGLLLLKGISEDQWNTAMDSRAEKLDAMEREYYGGVAVLAGSGPEDLDAKLVALSQLPAGFDLQQWVSLYMYGLALCAGYDPREFYPVSAGALGTATETETQHRKASSKGDLDFSLAHQEQLQNQLPPTILFEYEQRDVQGEVADVALQKAKADLITAMSQWVSGGASVLTVPEIRQLAAQHGIIPAEWTEEEENVTGDDTFPEADTTLANERVLRAVIRYPDEPIVRYSSRDNSMRVLWARGADAMKRRSYPVVKVVEAQQDGASGGQLAALSPFPLKRATISRSIESVTNAFRRDLKAIVSNYFTDKRPEKASALSARVKEFVSAGISDAYFAGLQESGIAPEDFTEDDSQAVDDLIFEQFAFVDNFVEAIVKARGDDDAEQAVIARADLWAASVTHAGSMGKMSAQKNKMLTLDGEDGADSCKDCQRYKGQRHRADWWISHGLVPKPGNPNYECGNWENCKHFLKDDEGNRWTGSE